MGNGASAGGKSIERRVSVSLGVGGTVSIL
jgi:hypothetical protein